MVHVLTRRNSDQLKYEMLQAQYVDLGDGSDPIVLDTTDGSTQIYNASVIQFGTNQ